MHRYTTWCLRTAAIKFTKCVSDQNSVFSPLQEKLCVGSKNDSHLLELSRRSLSACKVWGDRTMRAGCRNKNWCFFVCHAWSACAWGTEFKQVLCGSILMPFSAIFSEVIALSDALNSSHLRRQVAPQFSRNCPQKLRKVQKLAKSLCAPLRIDS